MIASEARIAANRANALKSTGPRTEEGKARSRANSFKHGMTGSGVVVGAGEADAIERRFASYRAEFAPATEAGVDLVRRAAALSVRLERSEAYEEEAVAARVEAAVDDFDEARMAEVDRLMALLAERPATACRLLRRMPEGVDRMVATWAALRSDLAHPSGRPWTDRHGEMAENLTGRRPDDFGVSRVAELSQAARGDSSVTDRDDATGHVDDARRELIGLIDDEAAKLRDHRATLDLGAIEAGRARAPKIALFDPSKEATRARQYEAAAERGMYRALKEMREVEAAARGASPAPLPSPRPEPSRLGSFSPAPAPAPAAARPVAPAPPPAADWLPPASQSVGGRAYSELALTIGRIS